ncbi:MAG: kinetochore-associated Ndc80 complex subunit ndc80 [Trizodia sp. TS-e1964]|nr:MAG: kinetochore-associated Ndc80 complex subunit ndc80 [Trizodia sp. TS-e1964]
MAQENGLFSVVRRPRETLGGAGYNTSIPQPASALKRSNSISNSYQNAPGHGRSVSGSRNSLIPPRPSQPVFHRASSGGSLAELGMSTIKRNSSSIFQTSTSGRKSYAPGSSLPSVQMSTQRRSGSSIMPRTSSMGSIAHQSFFIQGPIPAGVPRDPRPLKDRSYQMMIGQELMDFLARGGFELEMNHKLTTNTMKSPTQKDFNLMFQWLYHRFDPSYRFLKNIDAEVPPILKQLRYPFEKSITKSQIAAVGGQNWSTFLGLLHWMMQLAVMLDQYNGEKYDDACAEAGIDISGDRIMFRFLTNAYRDWLQVSDDDDEEDAEKAIAPHVALMAAEFDKTNQKYLEEKRVLEAEHKSLKSQIDKLEKTIPDITKLDEDYEIANLDVEKLEDYNSKTIPRIERYESRKAILKEEITKAEAELREAEEEQLRVQDAVKRQGIVIEEIDRMITDRERLQKEIEKATSKLQDLRRVVAENEYNTAAKLEELEKYVAKYNAFGYQIGVIPSSASNAQGRDYELTIKINEGPPFSPSDIGSSQRSEHDRLLADPITGYQAHNLLNLDLRGTVKSNLVQLRREIRDRWNLAQEADLKNNGYLDELEELIEDKKAEIETLDHRVAVASEEFEKLRIVTTTQKNESELQIERMQDGLARMRAGLTESLQAIEQREINTNIEYEQLQLRANAVREELHTEIERILNDVVKFKLHIQVGLGDYDAFAAKELEAVEAEAGIQVGDEDEAAGGTA